MHKHKGRTRFILFCVLPATILFAIFMVIPTFQVFWMSMFKWGGIPTRKPLVGSATSRTLMEDGKFLRSFQNTVLLIVLVTLVTFALALVFAGILTREKLRGQNFFRVVFYIPNILSVVVIAAIFNAIYDPSRGLLNSIIALFTNVKDNPILWLGDKQLVIYSLAGALVWQAIGYYMVMYMACNGRRARKACMKAPVWRARAGSASSSKSRFP